MLWHQCRFVAVMAETTLTCSQTGSKGRGFGIISADGSMVAVGSHYAITPSVHRDWRGLQVWAPLRWWH